MFVDQCFTKYEEFRWRLKSDLNNRMIWKQHKWNNNTDKSKSPEEISESSSCFLSSSQFPSCLCSGCAVIPQLVITSAFLMSTHDFTSIHPARTAGNNFLWTLMMPYAAVGQTCRYGFFHSSSDQEDSTWSWSRLQVHFLACLAFPFSFLSIFSLCAAWWRKKSLKMILKQEKKKGNVHGIGCLFACIHIHHIPTISTAAF